MLAYVSAHVLCLCGRRQPVFHAIDYKNRTCVVKVHRYVQRM